MSDVSIPAAALAGVVSFLSPCVLPLVPGYLAFVSGTSVVDDRGRPAATLSRVSIRAAAFVLGFATIFILLGASASQVGRFLLVHGAAFARIAGAAIVIFGLHLLGVLKIPLLHREKRVQASVPPRSVAGAYGIGMAFGFGWTPCIGPILAAVLAMAAVQDTVWQGVGLLGVYSLGLGIPFMVAALASGYLATFLVRFRRYYRGIELASGALLILIGALIFFGRFTWLSGQLGFLQRFAL